MWDELKRRKERNIVVYNTNERYGEREHSFEKKIEYKKEALTGRKQEHSSGVVAVADVVVRIAIDVCVCVWV